MDPLWHELTNGFPDRNRLIIVLLRVFAAVLLGAVVGIERERAGKPAGLRTHMLVALGAAGFSLIGTELIAMTHEAGGHASDSLRVIEAVATGVGFLGAGAIMQRGMQVKGLTTAASIWVVAAAGVASGVGLWMLAALLTIFALITLSLLKLVSKEDLPVMDSSGEPREHRR